MGLRPFSKHPKQAKSPTGVDKPPPVFNKHGEDALLKGLKSQSSQHAHSGSFIPKLPVSPVREAAPITSSTALWVAASNAAAPHDESEFYEEEIVEESEYIEEEIIDEIPPFSSRETTIRFDEYDEMQTILHINDYTNHEINRAWFKRDDYDKMVALARKTAQKAEERMKELGKINVSKKGKMRIESRGLEAWTLVGATKTKIIKECALEAVWNEQSRQWDAGITDWDKIRDAYQKVSRISQKVANDRAHSDSLIVKQIRQMDAREEERKSRRRILGKTKAFVGKTAKATTGGVVKTTKLVGRTTKMTGKVALGTAKAATKTAVATATLDRKMFKEAIIPARRKRECDKELTRRPSLSSAANVETTLEAGTSTSTSEPGHDDTESVTDAQKKKSKLKLLGFVPIPGTNKTYREDRRQDRIEQRQHKQSNRPSWEAGLSAGKY